MALNAAWTVDMMEERGATVEQFAAAAVKARRHGALNPHAQFQSEVTRGRGARSPPHRPAADPADVLVVHRRGGRRWCSPLGPGPGPLVSGRPPSGRATATSTTTTGWPRPAAAAWDDAGIDPADVDVVELHDATSAEELYALESLGFYKPGDAGPATVAGDTTLGGKGVTVNTSGGLVARGHPLGATGIAQVVELTAQLRDEAGPASGGGSPIGGGRQHRWHDRDHVGTTDAAFIGIHVLEAG